MHDHYAEYALLDQQEREIAARKEAVKTKIIQAMVAEDVKSLDHSLGKFTVSKLKSWTYPDAVSRMEQESKDIVAEIMDRVKAEKALAESTGEATYTERESLRFTPVTL